MYIHCLQRRKSWRNSPSMSRYRPSFEEFAGLLGSVSCIPVYRQLTGDGLTPVSAFGRIERSAPSFLFESVIGGEKVGRFSFLGSEPFLRFEARGPEVTVTPAGGAPTRRTSADPFRDLETILSEYRSVHLPGLPRFVGGAVGYAAYDAVRYVERLPNPPADDRQLPDLCFAFYDRMVIFDHINKTVAAVAHAHVPNRERETGDRGQELRKSYQSACTRVDRLVERLQQGVADLQLTDIAPVGGVQRAYHSNFEPAAFESAVAKCREYIKAGDIFQVVLSQRLQTETRARPFDIYRTLRVVNPSPFMFFLR